MRHLHRYCCIAVPLCVIVLVIAASLVSVAAQSGTPYRDPQGRFTFLLPEGWRRVLRAEDRNLDFIAPDSRAQLVISSVPADALSLADATRAAILGFVMQPGYQPDPAGVQDVLVAGTPAKQFAFQFEDEHGAPLSQVVTVMLHDGVAYLVIYGINPPDPAIALAPAARAALASWQFTDGQGGEETGTAPARVNLLTDTPMPLATADAYGATGTAWARSYAATGTTWAQGYATAGVTLGALVEVPNYDRLPIIQARQDLANRGLALGSESVRAAPGVPSGVVTGQTPQPGSWAPRGTRIDLTVSA